MPFLTSGRSKFLGGSRVPPAPVPVAGAELLTNGGFESWTSATDVDNWAETIAGSSVLSQESTTVRSGNYAAKFDVVSSGNIKLDQVIVSAATWLKCEMFTRGSGGRLQLSFSGSEILVITPVAGVYNQSILSGRCSLNPNVSIQRYDAGDYVLFVDDVSAVPLTLSSLISTRPYASADCDISAAVTRTAGTQAGIAARVDSTSSPANFLIAYLDGAGNVKVDKAVSGTYTNVISGAVTYADGRILRLVCNGNNVSCYYHGTQVGTTQVVSDAGIVSNVNHGLFSTYAANTFTGYVAA